MKRTRVLVVSLILAVCLLPSCIDSDYDWDDLNKDAEFILNPVFFGSLEKIYVENLPVVEDPVDVPEGQKTTRREIVQNLFSEDIADKFFYEGAGDVKITSVVNVDVLTAESGIKIVVYPSIRDNFGRIIEEIKIPEQILYYGEKQDFEILIKAQYAPYMQHASDLVFDFEMTANTLNFSEEDFIHMENIKIWSKGIHFEF